MDWGKKAVCFPSFGSSLMVKKCDGHEHHVDDSGLNIHNLNRMAI